MLELFTLFDNESVLVINKFHNNGLDTFFYFLCKTWVWIPLYVYIIWQLMTTYGVKKGLIGIAFLATTVGVQDYMCNKIIKPTFERSRPFRNEEIHQKLHFAKELGITEAKMHESGSDFGFYSAHAGNFAALTFFILLALPRHKTLKTVIILATTLIGFARIYLCLHYPTDVITGFIAGSFLAYIFHKTFQFVIR